MRNPRIQVWKIRWLNRVSCSDIGMVSGCLPSPVQHASIKQCRGTSMLESMLDELGSVGVVV